VIATEEKDNEVATCDNLIAGIWRSVITCAYLFAVSCRSRGINSNTFLDNGYCFAHLWINTLHVPVSQTILGGRGGGAVSGDTWTHSTRTTLGEVSTRKCLELGLKAEICIKKGKINSAKLTVIKWPRETQRKRDSQYGLWKASKANIESAFRETVITCKHLTKLPRGKGCLGYLKTYE